MSVSLGSFEEQFQKILDQYDDKASALLPCLNLIQKESNYISEEVVEYLVTFLDLSRTHIEEVISYYPSLIRREDPLKIIKVCNNVNCKLFGAEEITNDIKKQFKLNDEGLNLNKKILLQEINCLGICDQSPCIQLPNDNLPKGNLKKDEVINSIEALI